MISEKQRVECFGMIFIEYGDEPEFDDEPVEIESFSFQTESENQSDDDSEGEF